SDAVFSGGWTVNYWDEPMGQLMGGIFTDPFELLLGRKTYEIFAAQWPLVGKDDPIGKVFNDVTKYVATTSTEQLTWANSVALRGDA
ncbi:dihydrofolate reductase, partial [Rhizobium ruizarguesonis]